MPNPENINNDDLEALPVEVIGEEIEDIDQEIDNVKKDFSKLREEIQAYIDIGEQVNKTSTEGVKIATTLAIGGAVGATGAVIEIVVLTTTIPVIGPLAGLASGLYWVYRGRREQSLETKETIAKKRKIDFEDFIAYQEQLTNKMDNIEQKIIQLSKEDIEAQTKETLISARLQELERVKTKLDELYDKFYSSISFSNETPEDTKAFPESIRFFGRPKQ